MTPNTAKFAVVIKTDSYGGNFEREMCAHVTGHVGECEVGKEYVDTFVAKEFEDIIGNEPDDNGCYRPVTLGCNIKGFTNQDVVIFFEEEPTQKHIDLIKERLIDFDYSGEKVLGLELVEFHKSVTKKEI
jgi:hypothetical protein